MDRITTFRIPWASYSLTATAPAGTTQVRVEFASNNGPGDGGSIWFENADLEPSVAYPAIANVYPDGTILMQVTNTLSFTASSGAAITNIQVVLNGVDVSSNLVVTGSSTSKCVTYSGLKTNQAYAGTITVKDANNLSASVPLRVRHFHPGVPVGSRGFRLHQRSLHQQPDTLLNPRAGKLLRCGRHARR